MSKRFLNWAETWIEDNIRPSVNPDLENHDDRAKRMMDEMFAQAAAANFPDSETREERKHIAPLVLAAVSDSTDFDYDAFTIKYMLAQETEDGD